MRREKRVCKAKRGNMIQVVRIHFLILIWLFSVAGSPTRPQDVPRKSTPRPVSDSPVSSARSKRSVVLQQVPRLANEVLTFSNVELRVRTLIGLADILWKRDEADARQLFVKAFEVLRSIEESGGQSSGSAEQSTTTLPRNKLRALFVVFLTHLGSHDVRWQQKLIDDSKIEILQDVPELSTSLDFETANMLLTEKDPRGIDFIAKGLGAEISGFSKSLQVLDLLLSARSQDENRADQLFLQALGRIESQSRMSADDLLVLGNYVFTSSAIAVSVIDVAPTTAISPTHVGGVGFHAGVPLDRQGVSPEIVRAYLLTAIKILTRPTADRIESGQNRAAAFLLLPKAQRFAPDLANSFGSLASGISETERLTSETTSDSGPSRDLELNTVLERIDKIKDVNERDVYCLRMVKVFYSRQDFGVARKLTERISTNAMREQVEDLISFREAVSSFLRGDLSQATEQAKKLSSSSRRGLLWFAISKALIKRGDLAGGKMAIAAGLDDARKAEPPDKASLLLLAAELLASIDLGESATVFDESLKALNSIPAKSLDFLRFDQVVRLKVGSQLVVFETNVGSTNTGSLRGALKQLFASDPQNITASLLQLNNEYVKSSAILALLGVALDSIKS